jgi:anion-transporting  ArsA/GET3 family ATPase
VQVLPVHQARSAEGHPPRFDVENGVDEVARQSEGRQGGEGLFREELQLGLNRLREWLDDYSNASDPGNHHPEPTHPATHFHSQFPMVLRETQRAFVYFSLHGLAVDGVLVNRVLPAEVTDAYFQEWQASQTGILEEIDAYFAPVPVKRIPLFTHEVLGRERLEELARAKLENRILTVEMKES